MRTASVDIDVAELGDLDAIARLWCDSALEMDGHHTVRPDYSEMRRKIDDELCNGWELFAARREGVIIGMLALRPHDAVLDQLFVLTRCQKTGVGRQLLSFAKARMPDGFTLRMASDNERASRFYLRQGMSELKRGVHPRSGAAVTFLVWQRDYDKY